MAQQYDQLQAKNLPLDRSPNVLAAIEALESEGFYQGSDDINLDFKTVTSHGEWEIKSGYTDSLLYVTVGLPDGGRWLIDMEDCEEDFLPTNQQLLVPHPKILEAQMARIKQRKYERMMQAIAWVKELLEVKEVKRSPSPKHISALAEAGFQDLGNYGDYDEDAEENLFLETCEDQFGDWRLKALHRDDDLVFLDAVHESERYWQLVYKYNSTVSLKSLVTALKQLLMAEEA